MTLALVGALILGALAGESAKTVLSLGGGFRGKTEWWQALSCHTVHFGWGHFWRVVPPLALWGWLVESKSRPALLVVLGIAAWTVPAAVLLCEPEVLPYRGASGLACATVTWLAANAILRRDAGRLARLTGLAALVALAAKIGLELTEGRLMGGEPGGTVVVSWSAHLAGALAGLCVSLFGEAGRVGRSRRHEIPGTGMTSSIKGGNGQSP